MNRATLRPISALAMRVSSRTIDSAELANRIETPTIVAYNPNVVRNFLIYSTHCLVSRVRFFSAFVEIQIGPMQRDLGDNDGSRICQIEYQVVSILILTFLQTMK